MSTTEVRHLATRELRRACDPANRNAGAVTDHRDRVTCPDCLALERAAAVSA